MSTEILHAASVSSNFSQITKRWWTETTVSYLDHKMVSLWCGRTKAISNSLKINGKAQSFQNMRKVLKVQKLWKYTSDGKTKTKTKQQNQEEEHSTKEIKKWIWK